MIILLRQKPLPQVVRQIVQRDNGAWFDPEDMSTMFQDAAGTTPVTALEQPVGKWLDKSGNGNHATQSITASRPTLSARYNLLTKTEDFSDAAWVKSAGGAASIPVITNNYGIAPDGSSTACRIQLALNGGTTASDQANFYQNVSTIAGAPVGHGVWVKTADNSTKTIRIDFNATPPTSGSANLTIDGVWTYTERFLTSAVDNNRYPFIRLRGTTGTSDSADILIWHPNMSLQTKLPPYQRVNTSTDYDSVGWPRYLRGDGIDDFYNLPFMNLYGNGACSIVAARDAVSQVTDTYVISERSTTDVDPKYFPSRQLASGGNMDSYIVSDEGAVRLDTMGSAFSGAKLAAIRSVVDSGNNIKLFKDGAVVSDDNYTRAGTLTLNNTTLGASVSTTTGNYANMRLYGLILTKSALSDTDRRRCEQFLASRLSTLGVTLS